LKAVRGKISDLSAKALATVEGNFALMTPRSARHSAMMFFADCKPRPADCISPPCGDRNKRDKNNLIILIIVVTLVPPTRTRVANLLTPFLGLLQIK